MKCSFCGKPKEEVDKIIAADNKIGICDECVKLAYRIVKEGPINITYDMESLRNG